MIEALTRTHFANEEGGTASPEERQRYRATPTRRVLGVAFGLVCIMGGAFLLSR
jgi:hypothetical protein